MLKIVLKKGLIQKSANLSAQKSAKTEEPTENSSRKSALKSAISNIKVPIFLMLKTQKRPFLIFGKSVARGSSVRTAGRPDRPPNGPDSLPNGPDGPPNGPDGGNGDRRLRPW